MCFDEFNEAKLTNCEVAIKSHLLCPPLIQSLFNLFMIHQSFVSLFHMFTIYQINVNFNLFNPCAWLAFSKAQFLLSHMIKCSMWCIWFLRTRILMDILKTFKDLETLFWMFSMVFIFWVLWCVLVKENWRRNAVDILTNFLQSLNVHI
jgi:hypothetical protein